jgi:hypothetical protein
MSKKGKRATIGSTILLASRKKIGNFFLVSFSQLALLAFPNSKEDENCKN